MQAGLLSLVIFLSGVPTRSYNAEGNIGGGVFAKNLCMYGISGLENREIP